MKNIFTFFGILTTTAAFGASQASAPESSDPKPGDYDYDLFRKNDSTVFINAEFLYWTVNEGVNDYAIKMKSPAWGRDNETVTHAVGQYKLADFGWDPGFRGSIGFFNAPSYWDTYIQYTYYKGTGSDRTSAPEGDDLFLNGTWPHPNPTGEVPLASADTDIQFRLDLLEWLVTRRFFPNPHLRMRVYGGIDVAWLKQNWAMDYLDTEGVKSHLHNHWRFTGAGLRLGYIIDWYMHIKGLYLTGAISAAGLAGSYRNITRQTSHYVHAGYNPELPFANSHYHDTRLISHVQVMAGPAWQQAFDGWRAELSASYEFNIWSNLHEVYRSLADKPTGSKQTIMNNSIVGIQGVSVRLNIDF